MRTTITADERDLIVYHYKRLLTAFRDAPQEERAMLRKAYDYALAKYSDSKIETGEFYLAYTSSIASIVALEMELKIQSVIAALLQDIQTGSNNDLAEIKDAFGEDIAQIVESLNKISSLQTEKIANQSDHFIKYLLSIADDIRVILIRLADRLHYMRVLDALPEPFRIKISSETKNLYAPLAHRLGLYKIKTELEELSMKYGNPVDYFDILKKLEDTKAQQEKYIQEFIIPIKEELDILQFDYEIKWRTKAISSIYQKMKKQNVPFEEVFDLFAIRIILNSKNEDEKIDCWHVYSIVTNHYLPSLERMRDWITNPRENGY